MELTLPKRTIRANGSYIVQNPIYGEIEQILKERGLFEKANKIHKSSISKDNELQQFYFYIT